MLDLLIYNSSEVVTAKGSHREAAEQALRCIPQGVVGIRNGLIVFLGQESELPANSVGPRTRKVDAHEGFVSPGLVDPHTHLVFSGERSNEFEMRNQGASYLDIAKAGGGIMSTVRATRQASEEELVLAALPRLQRLLQQGVTTVEIKSGYGLNVEDELKMLRAVKTLSIRQPIEIVPTLMCGHAIPQEFRDNRQGYLQLCLNEILPKVCAEKLARFFDVFIEDGAFTQDEARILIADARRHGLEVRLHVDQLTFGQGAEFAAQMKAVSADHLEQISDVGIAALAHSEITAVLAPMSTLFLRVRPYAPGRKLREAGVNVALASNINPGSAMSESLSFTMGLACLENGLTPAEAFWGFTRGAALALKHPHAGHLELGNPADVVVWKCRNYRHLPYHMGVPHAGVVMKRGEIVFRDEGMCG